MPDWTVIASHETASVSWTGIEGPTPLDAVRNTLITAAKQSVTQPQLPFMLGKDERRLLMKLLHEALTAPSVQLSFDQRRYGAALQERLGELMDLAGDARLVP